MSRHDARRIAAIIRDLPFATERRDIIALRFADSFAAEVAHFDRWKFLQACGCLSAVLSASLSEAEAEAETQMKGAK